MTSRIEALALFFTSDGNYKSHCVTFDAGFTQCAGTYNMTMFYCPDRLFTPPTFSSYYGSRKDFELLGCYYTGSDREYQPTLVNEPVELEYRWKEK